MYLRHIYFYVNKLEDPMELIELLKMNNEYIDHIEMIDKNNGVIIEKNPTNVDLFIYKQLQELIMEDFNFKITFYLVILKKLINTSRKTTRMRREETNCCII